MKFTILTLFPEMLDSVFADSILASAKNKKLIEIEMVNIRDFADNKHKRVDDTTYGGGAGMLMTCQPLFDCIEMVKLRAKENHCVIFVTPSGERLNQIQVESFSKKYDEIIILCGRYEGIDQRVRDALVDYEISIGDYVLTGGELAAGVLVDSISRLIPGVLGKEASHEEESFSKSLERKREYPQYTKPADFRGMKVPDVLLSGHNKNISKWRKDNCF